MRLFFTDDELQRYLGFNDRWLMVLGIPFVAAFSNALFGGFDHVDDTRLLWSCALVSLVYTSVYWFAGRTMLLVFRRRFPDPRDLAKRVGATVGGIALTVFVVIRFASPYLDGLQERTTEPSSIFKVTISYLLCLVVLGGYEWFYHYVNYRRSELERERLTRENVQTQLTVLKQQMNPHFLFNSLNTLASIIPEDTAKATRFTQRLAATYRRILEYRNRETVSLGEEMACLQDYLYLLQSRFEDKLRVVVSVDPDYDGGVGGSLSTLPPRLAARRVVPLAAQLLVENAVKHNVVSAEQPLTLHLRLDDDRLTIRNTLNPRAAGVASTGWGHENLRRRYGALTDRPLLIERTNTEYIVSLPLLEPEPAADVMPVAV